MKMHLAAIVLLGAVFAAVPVVAQTSSPKPAAIKPGASAAATTHATKGVVKAVNPKALILSHAKGKTKDRTFVLTDTTSKQGDIAVGATVDIRYRLEGADRVATAVSVHQAKSPAKKKTSK